MAKIVTGIEIGRNVIQAVEISVQRKKVRILRFIEEIQESDPFTAEGLSSFVSRHSINKECVVMSVPGDMLITRQLSIPFRERSKIDKVIPFEVEPLVPFPIQDLEISYRVLSREKGKSDLLVYALPKNILDQRSSLFEEAGIPFRMIVVSSLASANSLLQIPRIQEQDSFLHLHVASKFSILSVYEKGVLNHFQRLPWSEETFLGTIQEMTELDHATLYRRLQEASPSETGELLDTLKKKGIELTPQIRKGLQTYLVRSQGGAPEALYVTGSVPGLQLLPPLLEGDLSMQVEIPDLLTHFPHDLKASGAASRLHTPLGMALMGGARDSIESSFRKKKFSLTSRLSGSRQEIRYAAMILIFLCLAFTADFFVSIQAREHHFNQLKNETQRIFKETFPDVKNVVNELAQMKLKINEVEKQNEIFKSLFGEKPAPLAILNELSTLVPEEIELSITDLTIDQKAIRFVGWTDSFNSVNRVEQELKKSEIFEKVSVSNAKIGKDKKGVNFQIKITYKE